MARKFKTSYGRRKKTSTGRIYVTVIMLFVIVVMGIQIVNLYQKNESYKAEEESLQKQLDDANNEKDRLAQEEERSQTDEYAESEASQKLGLVHDNWIIFREKEN